MAGCIQKGYGYRLIGIDGRLFRASRLAWLYMTGAWPSSQVDDIDLDKDNNRWNKLREATAPQNQANRYKPITNRSGFKGVSWYAKTGKWVAHIRINGRSRNLGYFDTPERAFIAYVFAAWRHFGDFARIDADYLTHRRFRADRRRTIERSL